MDAIGSHDDASVRISEAVTKVGNDKSPIKKLSHNDGRIHIEGSIHKESISTGNCSEIS